MQTYRSFAFTALVQGIKNYSQILFIYFYLTLIVALHLESVRTEEREEEERFGILKSQSIIYDLSASLVTPDPEIDRCTDIGYTKSFAVDAEQIQ